MTIFLRQSVGHTCSIGLWSKSCAEGRPSRVLNAILDPDPAAKSPVLYASVQRACCSLARVTTARGDLWYIFQQSLE